MVNTQLYTITLNMYTQYHNNCSTVSRSQVHRSARNPSQELNFVRAKFYCLHALADGNWHVWIMEKDSMVSPPRLSP